MILRNPYASASNRKHAPTKPNDGVPDSTTAPSGSAGKIVAVGEKRTQRPWERQNAVQQITATAAPLPSRSFSPGSSVDVNCTTTKSLVDTTAAVDDLASLLDEDDGFDWMAAVESLDAVAHSATAAAAAASPPLASGIAHPPHQQPQQCLVHQQSSANRNKPLASNDVSSDNRRVINQQKHGLGMSANTVNPEASLTQKAMVSLGPDLGYNKNKSTGEERNGATASSQNDKFVVPQSVIDPRQHGLPKELCFNPKCTEPVDDGHLKTLIAHAKLASKLLNGWELFPHQIAAIKQSLGMRRFILALDMGLGKTLIGCVWASAFLETSLLQCRRACVLAPVSLGTEWKRTAEQATGLHVVASQEKKLGKQSIPLKENRLKNKNHAASSDEETDDEEEDNSCSSPFLSIHTWSKVPSPPEAGNYVVVADEAHSMQSMEAARTRSALELMLHKRCIGVLLLSGTPMKNGKPSNLFPLLKAVRHPLGKNQRAYETHFCEGRPVFFGKTRKGWRADGSANLDQLRSLTKSHMLHLLKDDCLEQLPPKTRVFEKVPVCSRKNLEHQRAMEELVKIHQASKIRGGDGDAVLGSFQKLRLIGSLAKVEATVRYAEKILEEEPAIVVFTSFQEPARLVHRKLAEAGWKGEILTGETPPQKRQALVDNFQNGLSPVLVCTFGAGGVGLTLTAARTVILMDRPWTPGDVHQAEDRVRRIGQRHAVKCIWMRAFELDEKIDDMIAHKDQTSNAVLVDNDEQREGGRGKSGSPSSNGNKDAPGLPKQKQQRVSILKLLDEILLQDKKKMAEGGGLKQTSIRQFSQPTSQS